MIENVPNLFIPAFAKSGTTTLGVLLGNHPQIELPDISNVPWVAYPKEPGYFMNVALEYCKEGYKGDCRYRLDGTPFYHLKNISMESIAEYSESPKILVIMRDPVARAVSHWNHFSELRNENHKSAKNWGLNIDFTFDQQIDHELSGAKGDLLPRCRYVNHIKRMLGYFDRDQICFLFMEDMARDPDGFFNVVFDFLEVRRQPVVMSIKNAREMVFEPKETTLDKLRAVLYRQLPELKEFTGHIPDEWGNL